MHKNKGTIRTCITIILTCAAMLTIMCGLSGCGMLDAFRHDLKGSLIGNAYECQFYSNYGDKFMTLTGEKIDMSANYVKEASYSDDSGWGYNKTLSSVITITIDGKEVKSCGSTILFIEKGLYPDVSYLEDDDYVITSDGGTPTLIANAVNKAKNEYGKPVVVIIQSQLGMPICAFSGNSVTEIVCEDLPKTTKLMIDGHALYIHRANYQLIDKALLK